MNVAIIGAGISGLACAYELERHGIVPTIFEKRRRIGEDIKINICTFQLFDRMYGDVLKYINDKYNLKLKPLNNLNKIIMMAPNKKTVMKNICGYIFQRGDYPNSIENQIACHVRTPIIFCKYVYAEDVKNKFDYVVDATGAFDLAKQLNIYKIHVQAFSRVSIINGNFDVSTITMWLNTEYCNKSFAYLLPHSPEEACLVLSVDGIVHPELDVYWERFITMENIKNKIIRTQDILHDTGEVFPHKVDNIYFVGKAGGFMESILGFGTVNAIESGILAARSIVNNLDYEEMIKPIYEYIKGNYEHRKILNTFDNNDFDRLTQTLGIPGIKQIIYNNPLVKISKVAFLAKLYDIICGNCEHR